MLLPLLPGLWLALAVAMPVSAQTQQEAIELTPSGQAVAVDTGPSDDRIAQRIEGILKTTGWFDAPRVSVEDGIVFMDGTTRTAERRAWAAELAANTAGVVAVVNRVQVDYEVELTLTPAWRELRALGDAALRLIPSVIVAILVLPLAWITSRQVHRLARYLLTPRMASTFTANLAARAISLPVLFIGIYLILQVAGLTQLALSMIGGAGVLGIVIGFAFRDIVENFLASVLLSFRQPFRRGDLIAVAGHQGVVHSMNTRSTVLASADGNHIQIPNAVVFKSTIENFTINPTRRDIIELTLPHTTELAQLKAAIAEVARAEAALSADPAPLILIDALGPEDMKVVVHYWFDGQATSPQRLRSRLLRQILRSLHGKEVSSRSDAPVGIGPDTPPDDALVPASGVTPEQLRTPVEGSDQGDLLSR
ncbi:mechanosensitive ion channel family protein [Roseinatronobacter alkalisoli]|uniref:Small-conductance mechanosensitive channel n=1 Tax=Roseinatronobacter alkalisoli TaxID=3028235 RepID=A0ABT5TB03_9RHOB|nr:mechanosensitive ion channel domain-containing protein [Roseinatronobacter sp. HJB301]MDD7972298.1 mechanosensitive ion channel [Roseinatronobacter sp. HJB301]